MQSINIGDAISAQRRQFGQGVRKEGGREQPPTISDTVARYKTVTLVNISDQQIGIVFSQVRSYSTLSCHLSCNCCMHFSCAVHGRRRRDMSMHPGAACRPTRSRFDECLALRR